MKKILIIIIFSMTISICKAQVNLVPNPSFEIFDTCPNFIGQINRAIGWYAAMETPDYFNICSTDTFPSGQHIVNVPLNWAGYRTPASGNSYAGIIARWAYTNASKEAVGTQLITPLQIGVKYYASFKVSLGGEANHNSYCGINKIGILFSSNKFDGITPTPTCNNCAQICSDSIITDTLNWTRIMGSFIADSSYSFISIGRFNFNIITDSIQVSGSGCNAYYFIDDVCLSEDSSFTWNYNYTLVEKSDHEIFINYYPNPVKDFLTIKFNEGLIQEFRIYNELGILAKIINNINSGVSIINLSELTHGVYNFVAYTKNQNHFNFKIIKL